jgi:hypothetical protein
VAYSQTQLEALEAALASGMLRVSFEGRSVEYRSVEELKKAIAEVKAALAGGGSGAAALARDPDLHGQRFLMGYWRNLVRAAFGPPLRALAGYEAAATSRRTLGWNPANEGINALVAGGGDALRARSRDMVRRNAWASNAVESFVGNAVGTGIKPQAKHPDPAVKRRLAGTLAALDGRG